MTSQLVHEVQTPVQRLTGMGIRWDVFVEEQDVPLVLEVDARDFLPSTVHLLAVEDGRGVGTARLLDQGSGRFTVGRVAVLEQERGRGIGAELMKACEEVARRSDEQATLVLDAQVTAVPFYEKLGYRPTSRPVFLDAGIWHQEMAKSVSGV